MPEEDLVVNKEPVPQLEGGAEADPDADGCGEKVKAPLPLARGDKVRLPEKLLLSLEIAVAELLCESWPLSEALGVEVREEEVQAVALALRVADDEYDVEPV